MFDIFVATPKITDHGQMILARNSSREPNEPQSVIRFLPREFSAKDLEYTNEQLPSAKHSFEFLLSKPFHLWGGEMGVNEKRVAIANEKVYTKIKAEANTGLTGSELTRIALERSENADQALEILISLIETYGQSGVYGYTLRKTNCQNCFMIADTEKAWLLETADRQWVAKEIKTFRWLSKTLSIGDSYDLSSKNVVDFAIENGWHKSGDEFSFKKAYSPRFPSRLNLLRSFGFNAEAGGKPSEFGIRDAINILSSHSDDNNEVSLSFTNPGTTCQHATGMMNSVQTNGSMIAELRSDRHSTIWFTGTSNPCLSVYKPFYLPGETAVEGKVPEPTAMADDSLWWTAEQLYRKVSLNYAELKALFENERIELQNQFLHNDLQMLHEDVAANYLNEFTEECIEKHFERIAVWSKLINSAEIKNPWHRPILRSYLKRINKLVNIEM